MPPWIWLCLQNLMTVGLLAIELFAILFIMGFPIPGATFVSFRGRRPPKCCPLLMWPPKGTSLRQTASFEPLTVKIGPTVWPVGVSRNKKKKKKTDKRVTLGGIAKGPSPCFIPINFCRLTLIQKLARFAKSYENRSNRKNLAGGQNFPFPIDLACHP